MRETTEIAQLMKEIESINPKLLHYKIEMDWLLKKFEDEEKYEICELLLKHYDLVFKIFKALNALEKLKDC